MHSTKQLEAGIFYIKHIPTSNKGSKGENATSAMQVFNRKKIAKANGVKPTSIKKLVKTGNQISNVIQCWNQCKIELVKENGETKWRSQDGSLQQLSSLRVKVLYKHLGTYWQKQVLA